MLEKEVVSLKLPVSAWPIRILVSVLFWQTSSVTVLVKQLCLHIAVGCWDIDGSSSQQQTQPATLMHCCDCLWMRKLLWLLKVLIVWKQTMMFSEVSLFLLSLEPREEMAAPVRISMLCHVHFHISKPDDPQNQYVIVTEQVTRLNILLHFKYFFLKPLFLCHSASAVHF